MLRAHLDEWAQATVQQPKFGMGYDYCLSKLTNLYAGLGTARKAGTAGTSHEVPVSATTLASPGIAMAIVRSPLWA